MAERYKPWSDDEIAKLGTAADAEIAEQLKRALKSVREKRRTLSIPAFNSPESQTEPMLVGEKALGNYLGCSSCTVSILISGGAITPASRGPGNVYYFRPDDAKAQYAEHLDAAKAKMREVGRRTQRKLAKRRKKLANGVETGKKAARRLGVAASTIRRWDQDGWIKPIKRGRPGVASEYLSSDVDEAAAYAAERLRAARNGERLRTEQARAKARKTRQPPDGQLSAAGVADRLRMDVSAVYVAYRAERLPAVSKKPLRFTIAAVDDFGQSTEPLKQGYVDVDNIAARVVNEKLTLKRAVNRIRYLIKKLGIPTELFLMKKSRRKGDPRRKRGQQQIKISVREEQVPRILAHMEFDEQREDESTMFAAAKEYRKDRRTIRAALNKHAPDCGRETRRLEGAGIRKRKVYPRAAIAAALRGEHWTPAQPPAAATGERDADGIGGSGEGNDNEPLRRSQNAQGNAQSKKSQKKVLHAWDATAEAAAEEFIRRFKHAKKLGNRVLLKEFCEEYGPTVRVKPRTLQSKLVSHRPKWDPENQFGARPRKPR